MEEEKSEEFLRLQHDYVLGSSIDDANDIVSDFKKKNSEYKLSDNEEIILASLPLKVELDAMDQTIHQTILTLCSTVSAEPLLDERLKKLDRQYEELEEQVDILKKEDVRLHRLFADHLLYISLERSLLKLDIEKAKQCLNEIGFPIIKEQAQARLNQFPLFAKALAKEVCQLDPKVYIEEEKLADLLQQCQYFIAYVVKKNAADFTDNDFDLRQNLHSNLSSASCKHIDPALLVEQAVGNTISIASVKDSSLQVVSLILDDSSASKQVVDNILSELRGNDIALLKIALNTLLDANDKFFKTPHTKNVLEYFNLDENEDVMLTFISLLKHMAYIQQCNLITTKYEFIERYQFEELEKNVTDDLYALYQQALNAYISLSSLLTDTISKADILKVTQCENEEKGKRLNSLLMQLKSSIFSDENIADNLLWEVAFNLLKRPKSNAAELFKSYREDKNKCLARKDLINRLCLRGVSFSEELFQERKFEGFDFRDCVFDNISFKGSQLFNCRFEGAKFINGLDLTDIICDTVTGSRLAKAIKRSNLDRNKDIIGQITCTQDDTHKAVFMVQDEVEAIRNDLHNVQKKLSASVITLKNDLQNTKERADNMVKTHAEAFTKATKKEFDDLKTRQATLEEKLKVVESMSNQYLLWRKKHEYYFGHPNHKVKEYFNTLVTKICAVFNALMIAKSGLIKLDERNVIQYKNKMGEFGSRGLQAGASAGLGAKESFEFVMNVAQHIEKFFSNVVTSKFLHIFHGYPILENIFSFITMVTEFATERWADNIVEDSSEHLDGLLLSMFDQLSVEIACAITERHQERIEVLELESVKEFAESGAFRVLVGLLNCQIHFESEERSVNYQCIADQIATFISRPEIKQGKVAKRVLNLSIGHQKLHVEKYFDVFLAGNGQYFKVINGLLNKADEENIEEGLLMVFSKFEGQWVINSKGKKNNAVVEKDQSTLLGNIVKAKLDGGILNDAYYATQIVKTCINKHFKAITLDEDIFYRFPGEALVDKQGNTQFYSNDFPNNFVRNKTEYTLAKLIGYMGVSEVSPFLEFHQTEQQRARNDELEVLFNGKKEMKKDNVKEDAQVPNLMKHEQLKQPQWMPQQNIKEINEHTEDEVDALKKDNIQLRRRVAANDAKIAGLENRLSGIEESLIRYSHGFFQRVKKVDDAHDNNVEGRQSKVDMLYGEMVGFMKEFYENKGNIPK